MARRITSVRQLLELLEREGDSDLRMFRGQTRDWPLLPSIGRFTRAVRGYDDWRGFHEDTIYQFLRLGHPHLSGHSIKGCDSWVLGQHFGLPTRLLDTTTNPLKALFFSVNERGDDSRNGVLWVFSYTSWREELDDEYRTSWDDELVPFLPAQLNSRLLAQEGAFISYPLPQNCKPLVPMERLAPQHDLKLEKLIIPSRSKPKLRRELDVLGVQFRLLFPDLEGVARGIQLDLGS